MVAATRHCIIAGAPRCGTTSLFNALAKQKGISASSFKQTLFFLDKEYDGTVLSKRESDYSASEYLRYFPSTSECATTLEATPDYIYSSGAALRISECLGEHVQLVFLLRNPIERLVSCFYHEKQVGSISPGLSMDDFLGLQQERIKNNIYVQQGEYHKYLREYYDLFGEDSISVVFLDELSDLNSDGLKMLSERLSIDLSELNAELSVQSNARFENRSRTLLAVYRSIRKNVLRITQKNRVMAKILSYPVTLGSALYKKTNQSKAGETKGLSDDQYAKLKVFYAGSYKSLTQLTGRAVPWS